MQFEAKKLTRGRLATFCECLEDLMIFDAFVVAHDQFGGIDKVPFRCPSKPATRQKGKQ
jgi:hypothetical protein